MKFRIEKDDYVNCYIVWEIHTNYAIDIFHGKTIKACKEFIKELEKEL